MCEEKLGHSESASDGRLRPGQRRAVAFLATGVVLASILSGCNPVVHTSTGTSTNDHRFTLGRFSGVYHTLDFLKELPFPVRRPVTQNHSDANGTGTALYSWRAEISDLAVPWAVTWDESKPWDSVVNRVLIANSVCFAADHTPVETIRALMAKGGPFPETIQVAIVGPGTAFGEGKTQTPLKGLPAGAILLVESRASGIPWPAPGDFDIRTMPRTINARDGKGISGQNPGGFVVLFADGQSWFMSEKVPFETLEKFFTIDGAKKHDREKLLGPFALDRMKYGE
jgi:hypothetical protein